MHRCTKSDGGNSSTTTYKVVNMCTVSLNCPGVGAPECACTFQQVYIPKSKLVWTNNTNLWHVSNCEIVMHGVPDIAA